MLRVFRFFDRECRDATAFFCSLLLMIMLLPVLMLLHFGLAWVPAVALYGCMACGVLALLKNLGL